MHVFGVTTMSSVRNIQTDWERKEEAKEKERKRKGKGKGKESIVSVNYIPA